jgi:heme/copper-type cytochrome/quinol oxidase subunit 4
MTDLVRSLMPIIIVQFLFQLTALGHLVYKKKTRSLDPWIWGFIIIILGIIGALLYFTIGREDE